MYVAGLVEDQSFCHSRYINFRRALVRPTNHRYGHVPQTMMLPCGHPAYCWMRERSFKVTTWLEPVKATRGLLSIRASSGYPTFCCSIQ